jgi:hypothetical protein
VEEKTMTNPLREGVGRIDGRLLLRILDYLDRDKASTLADIAKLLKVSEHTATRMLRNARKQFGVKITYKKTNEPYSGAGEFTVEDWGVFDRARVRLFLRATRRR